jgi:plasmid stability protein
MKQAIYSSRTADKFVVRLPDGMRERIADVARNHHRSMNSEIIARLEQSLFQEGTLGDELNLRLDSPPTVAPPAECTGCSDRSRC